VGGVSTLESTPIQRGSYDGRRQSGQNFSQVTFNGTIPPASDPLLVLTGLAAMRAVRRKRAHVAV
jgi:hypothetical protein